MKNKKNDLEFQMAEFVKCILRHAEKANKLDDMAISMVTDNSYFKMDYTLSQARKEYVLSKTTI